MTFWHFTVNHQAVSQAIVSGAVIAFLGYWLILGSCHLYQRFTVKRVKPEDVRLSPDLLEQYRQELYRHRPEIVQEASKRPLKASPQRGNRR